MEKVIFDTNAYRYLVTDKTDKEIEALIKKVNYREEKNNIESLLNPIVAKELLAHIANKNDTSFKKCLKAIKALYYHNGNDSEYSMIPTPELLISNIFFKRLPEKKVETNYAFGQMAYYFAKKPNKHAFNKFQRNLNLNATDVYQAERGFAEEMENYLKLIDPDKKGWKVFDENPKGRTKALSDIRNQVAETFALGYLFIVRDLLEKEGKVEEKSKDETIIELKPMVPDFIKAFPEPIALYQLVLENMINSEFNLYEKNRGNFIWDIHMLFYAGQNSIQNSKIIFVTSDKAMIDTALGTNSNNTVLNFEEYMEYLGLK